MATYEAIGERFRTGIGEITGRAKGRILGEHRAIAEETIREGVAVTATILPAAQARGSVDEPWVERQPAYQTAQARTDARYRSLDTVANASIGDAVDEASRLGYGVARDYLGLGGYPVDVTRLEPVLMRGRNAAARWVRSNVTMPAIRLAAKSDLLTMVVNGVRDLLGGGSGARSVIDAVRRIVDGPQARLATTADTVPTDAARDAMHETSRQAGADYWQWAANHDGRTCLSCLAQSGTIHPWAERMATHAVCRCHEVPCDINGNAVQTGPDWFAEQSAETQRGMMPSEAAYQAFADGTLTLADFVGHDHSPIYGDSTYQRSGVQAITAAKRRNQEGK